MTAHYDLLNVLRGARELLCWVGALSDDFLCNVRTRLREFASYWPAVAFPFGHSEYFIYPDIAVGVIFNLAKVSGSNCVLPYSQFYSHFVFRDSDDYVYWYDYQYNVNNYIMLN